MKVAGDGVAAQGAESSQGGAAKEEQLAGAGVTCSLKIRLPALLLKCHRTSLHSHLSHAPHIPTHSAIACCSIITLFPHKQVFTLVCVCVLANCPGKLAIIVPFFQITVWLNATKARLLKYSKSAKFQDMNADKFSIKDAIFTLPIFLFETKKTVMSCKALPGLWQLSKQLRPPCLCPLQTCSRKK